MKNCRSQRQGVSKILPAVKDSKLVKQDSKPIGMSKDTRGTIRMLAIDPTREICWKCKAVRGRADKLAISGMSKE